MSHGHGPSNFLSSLRGYGPLADFWAGQGFVVIQPTHLDSATLPFRGSDNPEAPLFWRSRAQDMTFILDNLDVLEEMVPQIRGQLDREKIAIAGHSMGGYTASLLLGARTIDPISGAEVNLFEPRFKAGVIMSAPGLGGTAVSKNAIEHYPVFSGTDFSNLVTPSLVAYGTADNDPTQHLTVRDLIGTRIRTSILRDEKCCLVSWEQVTAWEACPATMRKRQTMRTRKWSRLCSG
nr:alpha/beta fold hydrolase [Xaviernesmea oryzae]